MVSDSEGRGLQPAGVGKKLFVVVLCQAHLHLVSGSALQKVHTLCYVRTQLPIVNIGQKFPKPAKVTGAVSFP